MFKIAGDMMSEKEKLEKARMEVGQAMAQTMDLYGYTPSTGMLYSLLYFSEEPMSLDELAEKMQVSKTTVSNGVRSMEERGILYKSWKGGSRRDYYGAETDFFANFINYFAAMWQREIDVNWKSIEKTEPIFRELLESQDETVCRQAESDLAKLEEAKKYYRWLQKMVWALESGEIFKCFPKDEHF